MFKKSPLEPEPTSSASAEFGPQSDSSDFEIEFDLDSLLAEGGPRSEAAEAFQLESGYFDDSDLESILITREEEPDTGFWSPSTDEDDEEIFDLGDLAPDNELEDETGRRGNSPANTIFLTDSPLPARPGAELKADEPDLPPYCLHDPQVQPTNNINEIQDFSASFEGPSSAWPDSRAAGDFPGTDTRNNGRFQPLAPENHEPITDYFKRFNSRASDEATWPVAGEPALAEGDDAPVPDLDINAEPAEPYLEQTADSPPLEDVSPEQDEELFIVGTEDHEEPELFRFPRQGVSRPPKGAALSGLMPGLPDEDELFPISAGLPLVGDLGDIYGLPQGGGPGEAPAGAEQPTELFPEIPRALKASRPNGSVVLPLPPLNSNEIIALLEDQPEHGSAAEGALRSAGRKSRRWPGSSGAIPQSTATAANYSPEALAALIEVAVEKAVTRALEKNINSLLAGQLPAVIEQAAECLATSLSRHFKPQT